MAFLHAPDRALCMTQKTIRVILGTLSALTLYGQQTSDAVSSQGRAWYNVGLPFLETASLPPITPGTTVAPLGTREKVVSALERTISPETLLQRSVLAGIDQWRNQPEEWGQGWDAYGQRYGYRMFRVASRNAMMMGIDLAMRTDQRYDRCDCHGFFSRTGHAVRRAFVARKDGGGETVNLARLVGAYATPPIAYSAFLPDRYLTTGRVLSSGSQYLGWRVFGNAIREFWPEIRRVIRIGPPPSTR
jgi:hypothetical protein